VAQQAIFLVDEADQGSCAETLVKRPAAAAAGVAGSKVKHQTAAHIISVWCKQWKPLSRALQQQQQQQQQQQLVFNVDVHAGTAACVTD
jgi:hypothetical protein